MLLLVAECIAEVDQVRGHLRVLGAEGLLEDGEGGDLVRIRVRVRVRVRVMVRGRGRGRGRVRVRVRVRGRVRVTT